MIHEGEKTLQPKDIREGFKIILELALKRERYRKTLKKALYDLPKRPIWRKIMDGPEEELWALAKRALRDIYAKMYKHELFSSDKSALDRCLTKLGARDAVLGKKKRKDKSSKKRPKKKVAKTSATRRKEIEALFALNKKMLVKLVSNVMKKWQPPDGTKEV